jgi:hypothetical protein
MRCRERFTPAESDVRDARGGDLPGDRQRLLARELIEPRLVRAGLLAAGEASRTAPIGQLPGNKERRRVLPDRAAFQAQRVKPSGKADIRLRHHLL